MPADWDWIVIAGLIIATVGVWLLWGTGAALLAIGIFLIIAGIGGAYGRIN